MQGISASEDAVSTAVSTVGGASLRVCASSSGRTPLPAARPEQKPSSSARMTGAARGIKGFFFFAPKSFSSSSAEEYLSLALNSRHFFIIRPIGQLISAPAAYGFPSAASYSVAPREYMSLSGPV